MGLTNLVLLYRNFLILLGNSTIRFRLMNASKK
jgi:hypothetical protein